jgi:hypothetical protein
VLASFPCRALLSLEAALQFISESRRSDWIACPSNETPWRILRSPAKARLRAAHALAIAWAVGPLR